MISPQEYTKSYQNVNELVSNKDFYQNPKKYLATFEVFIKHSKDLLQIPSINQQLDSSLAYSMLTELMHFVKEFEGWTSLDPKTKVAFSGGETIDMKEALKSLTYHIYLSLNPNFINTKISKQKKILVREKLAEVTGSRYAREITYINDTLGAKFVSTYLTTSKGKWIVYVEDKNCICARLEGVYLKKRK